MRILRNPDANTGGSSSLSPAAQANDAQQQGAKSPASPTGENNQEQQRSVKDVVRDVLKKHEAAASGKTPAEEGSVVLKSNQTAAEGAQDGNADGQQLEGADGNQEGKTPQADAGQKPADQQQPSADSKVDDSKLPFHTHPRFQQLIRERDTFETKVKELSSLEEPAKRMLSVERYCQENNIPPQDYDRSIQLAAMLNSSDPAKREQGLNQLKELVSNMEIVLGKALPSDLQQKVDDGKLALEDAQEVAALRLKAATGQHQVQSIQKQTAEQQQRSLVQALDSWTEQKMKADPSFKDMKYELVANKLLAACQATPPKNVNEAIRLAEKAYTEVHTYLDSIIPKPAVRRPQQQLNRKSAEEQPAKVDISKPGWAKEVGRRAAAASV